MDGVRDGGVAWRLRKLSVMEMGGARWTCLCEDPEEDVDHDNDGDSAHQNPLRGCFESAESLTR